LFERLKFNDQTVTSALNFFNKPVLITTWFVRYVIAIVWDTKMAHQSDRRRNIPTKSKLSSKSHALKRFALQKYLNEAAF